MLHREFDPPESLQDIVKCFWFDRREENNDLTGEFEVMPDGYVEIVFIFGVCSTSVDGVLQRLSSPFMMGLLSHPVNFYTTGLLEIIGVRFYPWTVFDFLGVPSKKSGVQAFEHPIAFLQPMLTTLVCNGEIDEAIDELRKYFVATQLLVDKHTMLHKAGVAMQRAKGTLPVNEVAAAAHATVRTLERNFKQSSGHTVKNVSALMRFEQVRNRLWTHPDSKLAALADEFGYADQSHLSREFKRFSGTTPAAFARHSKKDQQRLRDGFVAFVQA